MRKGTGNLLSLENSIQIVKNKMTHYLTSKIKLFKKRTMNAKRHSINRLDIKRSKIEALSRNNSISINSSVNSLNNNINILTKNTKKEDYEKTMEKLQFDNNQQFEKYDDS